jgi:amino acid transporter
MTNTDSIPVSDQRTPGRKLTGSIGAVALILSVLAFNGPLGTMVGFVPVVIGFGNGLGAPVAYIIVAALLLFFTVGFTTMGRKLPNPGAFYAYITAGLGKPTGLGASYLAVLAYMVVLLSTMAFFGVSMKSTMAGFGGPDLGWWAYAAGIAAIIAVLGYFKIDVSIKVVGIIMVAEIIFILLFDVAVVVQGGLDGLDFESFTPANITSGSIGLALLFAVQCFSGFEATAIYREETRNPARTIRRATFGAVIMLGTLYSFGAWVIIQALGSKNVVTATAEDPTGAFFSSMRRFVGDTPTDILTVTLGLGVFAACLSTHNVAARYLYNLGTDGILPRRAGAVHPKHDSPYIASMCVSAVTAIGLASLVASGADANIAYAALAGIGGYSLILLLLLTSISVLAYLRVKRASAVTVFESTIAPIVAIVGLVMVAVLATMNIHIIIGGPAGLPLIVLALTYLIFAIGIAHALILKRKGSPAYARIGRQD